MYPTMKPGGTFIASDPEINPQLVDHTSTADVMLSVIKKQISTRYGQPVPFFFTFRKEPRASKDVTLA